MKRILLSLLIPSKSLTDNKGQSSIFVLVLIGVVLVSTIFLYQSGRVTSEKMQLQNAADSAAYGASVLEARSLNFCAYTNRAMVANEVAVGQMVGMLSMADEIKSFGEYLQLYGDAIELATAWLFLVVTVGDVIEGIITAIVEILEAVGEGITEVGEAIEKVLDYIFPVVIKGLSINNEVYSVSQEIYHGATLVLVTTNLFKSVEDNTYGSKFNFLDLFKRKDRKGAQVSDVGLLSLAAHVPSYWAGYTKRYKTKITKKEKDKEDKQEKDQDIENDESGDDDKAAKKKKDKKDSKKDKNQEGMGRFAGVVRESRDPFTSGGDPIHVKNFLGMDVEYKNRDWFIGLDLVLEPHGSINLEVLKIDYDFDLGMSVGVKSKGGSEVRHKGDTYVWSGLDTLLGGPEFKFDYDIKITEDLIIKTFHQHIKGGIDVELGLPLGGGISQAIKSSGEDVEGGALTPLDFLDAVDILTLDPYAYGEAAKGERMIMAEAATPDLEDNQTTGYAGLQPYRGRPDDSAKEDPDKPPLIPFQAPFFLVGLTRSMNDITSNGPQFSDKLDIINDDNNKLIGQISAVGKSQVYFSRPKDLSYFLRADKKEENSNVFSPFWQARLVDTTNLDRILVLALQDHVVWLSGDIQDNVPGLKRVTQFLEEIFGIFR